MVAAEATTSTAHAIYAMDMRPAAQVILLRRSRDSFSDAMACLTQAKTSTLGPACIIAGARMKIPGYSD